jgi:hypothetical protein
MRTRMQLAITMRRNHAMRHRHTRPHIQSTNAHTTNLLTPQSMRLRMVAVSEKEEKRPNGKEASKRPYASPCAMCGVDCAGLRVRCVYVLVCSNCLVNEHVRRYGQPCRRPYSQGLVAQPHVHERYLWSCPHVCHARVLVYNCSAALACRDRHGLVCNASSRKGRRPLH